MNDVMLRITNKMEEKGIKQKELCEKIGINETNFSTWKKENNNRSGYKKHIVEIAKILNVTTEYLLTGKESEAEAFYSKFLQAPEHIQKGIKTILNME